MSGGRRARGRLTGLGLVLVLGLLAAGCGSAATGTASDVPTTLQPQSGGQVVYGIEADPNGLDPYRNSWDPSGMLIANAIYDPLAAFDKDGVPHPYLLQAWSHNADFTTWTLTMRPDVLFHNGQPADADALAKHVKGLTTSAITGPAATNIASVEKTGPLTVDVKTTRPWSSLPAILTAQAGMLAAPAQADDPQGSTHPVGTGPFKLIRWEVGKQVVVERNPGYWQAGLPHLDRVTFQPAPPADRITKLKSGTFDVIHAQDFATVRDLDAAAADGALAVMHDSGSTEPNMVMFNAAQKPLDDVRVRRAAAYAIDINALAKTNNWPVDRLTDSLYPKSSPWYTDSDFPRNDLDKAKALVAEVEKEKGPISFKLLTWADPVNLALAQSLVDAWAKIGVTVTVETAEFKSLVIRAVSGQYDSMIFRYFGQPEPEMLTHFWISETIRPIGQIGLNFSRLADDQIDAALWEARTTDDRAARKQVFDRIQRRQSELVPYLWLYHTDWVVASSTKLHDLTNGSLPDGATAMPTTSGTHRLTRAWVSR